MGNAAWQQHAAQQQWNASQREIQWRQYMAQQDAAAKQQMAEMYFVGQASGQRTVIQNIHVDQNQVNHINYEAHNTYHDNQNVHYMHNEENYHDGLDTPSIQSGDSYQDDVYDGSDTPSIQSGDSYHDQYYEDNFDDQYYEDDLMISITRTILTTSITK